MKIDDTISQYPKLPVKLPEQKKNFLLSFDSFKKRKKEINFEFEACPGEHG
jgi:hypothetical protein